MTDPFQKMRLGRTTIEITRLGLGTAGIGWLYAGVSNEDAGALLREAYAQGCTFFDTSPLYGSGLAELRVGVALAGLSRDTFMVSTKVGYAVFDDSALADPQSLVEPPRPPQDFSYDSALRLIEASLRRLHLDHIDIALIHDPDNSLDAALQGTYRALERLRDEGVVRAIGAGMNYADKLAYLARAADFDCFLLAGRYTLLDQEALFDLLPLCVERGIAICIGGPFNSGILADPYADTTTFNYAKAPQAWVAKARRIDALCQRHGIPLKAAALQFPLAHPAVVSVLTGARSVAEWDENVAMFRHPVSAALWADLRAESLLPADAPLPTE
jgi:D-threo-aldose 1-dehydrogenase